VVASSTADFTTLARSLLARCAAPRRRIFFKNWPGLSNFACRGAADSPATEATKSELHEDRSATTSDNLKGSQIPSSPPPLARARAPAGDWIVRIAGARG